MPPTLEKTPQFQNIGQFFKATSLRFPDKKALWFKNGGSYQALPWRDVSKKVEAIASFFLKKGLERGDRLAILSENRPEWALVDLAAQTIGVSTVPIYTSLTCAEIEYLLKDSGAKLLAVSSKALFEKIIPIQKSLPSLKNILGFDSVIKLQQSDFLLPIDIFFEAEKTPTDSALDKISGWVSSDDLASVIYTSGTTGVPKGVMLTHRNFIENILACKETLKMSQADVHLSFLPLCHIFERTAGHYLMIYLGASIAYAENMDMVPKNILEIKPTFLLGVPRFFEKIQARVNEAVKKSGPLKQGLFLWAKELRRKKRCGEKIPWHDCFLSFLAQGLVYRKFNHGLGGRLRFCVSGGAPLAKEIAEFFYDLGVMIYEGYGLTETSPVISVNRQERVRFGSVGIPLEGIQVKITQDGEIATKSACVMKGYFQKPSETAEVLKDGWFYTGDLGKLDSDGFLFITGRKKELIVTSGGKKVSPRPIEELLEKDPTILRCVLFGEAKKFITALIVPNRQALLEYAQENKISYDNYETLLKDKKIYDFLDQKIQQFTQDLASYEKIKYFALLSHDFSQTSGELTPTLKVKRDVVLQQHKDELLAFYAQ